MPLDSNIPLQSRLNPNPVGLGEMMQLGQAMRQRRAEGEQRRKDGLLKSMLEQNVELGPEGPKLNKPGFLSSLARSGMTQEAMQFQSQFQEEDNKRFEADINKNRMIGKRSNEIINESAGILDYITDGKEIGKQLKEAFDRERLPYKYGDDITPEKWAKIKENAITSLSGPKPDAFYTLTQSGGNQKSFNTRSGELTDPLVGGVPTVTPVGGSFQPKEITVDGKTVMANYNTKTGVYEIPSLGGGAAGSGPLDKTPIIPGNAGEKKEESQARRDKMEIERKELKIKEAKLALEKEMSGGENKAEFNKLPEESQIQVTDYAKAISAYKKSANGLEAALKTGREFGSDKEKITHYLLTLKNLNSPTNPDAVGAEEVTRIAPELKRQLFNFTNPSAAFIGTDVPAFERKLETFITNLRSNAESANKEIDILYGRGGASAPGGASTVGTVRVGKGGKKYQKIKAGPDSDKSTWGAI